MSHKATQSYFTQNFKSLLRNVTTVHGTSHFSSKNGTSLAIWMVAMIANVVVTVLFIHIISQKIYSDQIYTKLDSTCKVNQLPFPAVSICNFNIISLKETENIAKLLKQNNITQNEIENFFRDLPKLKDYDKYSKGESHYSKIHSILNLNFFPLDKVMEELHQKCQNLLLYCAFNGRQRKCENIFNLIKTVEGYCCAFNYANPNGGIEESQIANLAEGAGVAGKCTNASLTKFKHHVMFIDQLQRDDYFEYYSDDSEDDNHHSTFMIATSKSGRKSGLSVIFNVQPDDYPEWSLTPYYGAKILLTDPNDFPENNLKYKYVSMGQSLDIKVSPIMYQSEDNVRRLEPSKRNCWFHDEVILGHTDRYSYETCQTECRMHTYTHTCGCIPYKYPKENHIRICEMKDLQCLINTTAHQNHLHCHPPCFAECRDKRYYIDSDLTPFLRETFPADVTKGHNSSELSSVQVYYRKSTCNCYKLMLLFDTNHFIATYGGVFSLSFGGSILTLLEIGFLVFYSMIKFLLKKSITARMQRGY